MTPGIAVDNAADALDANRSRLAGRWWALGLIGLVFLVFGQSCRFEFVSWDDSSLIANNPYVNSGSWQGMIDAWKQPHKAMFIPVVYNLWALLAKLSRLIHPADAPLDPHLFHAANVLAHALNAVLVFYLIRRTLRLPRPAVFAGAALFAIHPLQMEAVCWATGMKDLLSGCLALLTIHCYCSAVGNWEQPNTTVGAPRCLHPAVKGHLAYSGAMVFFLLASLAKPGVVALPLIMGVLDVILYGNRIKSTLARLLPFVLIGLGATIWTGLAQPYMGPTPLPLALRPALAAHSLAFYLWKLFIPSSFAIDYGLTPSRVFVRGQLLWAWIAPMVLFSCITLRRYPFRRQLIGASLVFIAGVLPVLGFLPFCFQNYSTVADRYAYLSMAGAGLALAVLAAFASARSRVLLTGVLVGLAGLTLWQSRAWRTSTDLYIQTIRVNPNSSCAYNNLAVCLMPILNQADFAHLAIQPAPASRRADINNIEWLLTTAQVADPNNALPLYTQVSVWQSLGRNRLALKQAEFIAAMWPDVSEERRMFLSIGQGYAQIREYDAALKYLLLHLIIHPCDTEAIKSLAEMSLKRTGVSTAPTSQTISGNTTTPSQQIAPTTRPQQ